MDLPRNVVELLQALIAIPSVNPEGDGETGTSHLGEAACAQYVADFLRVCGARVVMEEVELGRPNVIARFGGEGDVSAQKTRLLFAPHLDTVSVAGMTIDPFAGELREEKIWGRGASDTKGTMAAMLWAFYELKERMTELEVEVGFVGLMGEEIAQPGSRHFAQHHGAEWDFAIVGEPTELKTVCRHKGCTWVKLVTKGKAAHGSTPERGENAIMRMNEVLRDLGRGFMRELQQLVFKNEFLGHPTLNIGTMQGGSKTNIVPDHCEVTLDFRETPELAAAGGVAKLLPVYFEEKFAAGSFPKVEVEMLSECPALDTPEDHFFVKHLAALGAEPVGAPWLCDATWLAKAGIASVALGPGSIAQAHTEDEYLEVEALQEGVVFYRKIMEEFRAAKVD
ncbi:MAG: M20 family metallopeptidase [Verrucomicrobiales bacterium]|nr:M20 family metallopeptidase [Verrucomicrobiales bacterium]